MGQYAPLRSAPPGSQVRPFPSASLDDIPPVTPSEPPLERKPPTRSVARCARSLPRYDFVAKIGKTRLWQSTRSATGCPRDPTAGKLDVPKIREICAGLRSLHSLRPPFVLKAWARFVQNTGVISCGYGAVSHIQISFKYRRSRFRFRPPRLCCLPRVSPHGQCFSLLRRVQQRAPPRWLTVLHFADVRPLP